MFIVGNDPINMCDPSGHFVISATLFISSIVIGSLIGGVTSFYSSIKKVINGMKLL